MELQWRRRATLACSTTVLAQQIIDYLLVTSQQIAAVTTNDYFPCVYLGGL